MRKAFLGTILLATLAFLASSIPAQAPNSATVITAGDISSFLKGLPHNRTSDAPIRVVASDGYQVGVSGVYRPKSAAPTAIAHQTKVAEVYYMLSGSGTLVTGGTLRPPTKSAPSNVGHWTDITGAGIDGGVMRHVAKGDVVIIPGGMPHQWLNQSGDVTYIIVRPDPDKQLALK